jgi:hypothetical protein
MEEKDPWIAAAPRMASPGMVLTISMLLKRAKSSWRLRIERCFESVLLLVLQVRLSQMESRRVVWSQIEIIDAMVQWRYQLDSFLNRIDEQTDGWN